MSLYTPTLIVEQLEAPLGVVAIGGTATLLIGPGSDKHNAGEIRIVAIAQHDLGTERRAVAQVGGDRFGPRPPPTPSRAYTVRSEKRCVTVIPNPLTHRNSDTL
jgi:hypothetical protein